MGDRAIKKNGVEIPNFPSDKTKAEAEAFLDSVATYIGKGTIDYNDAKQKVQGAEDLRLKQAYKGVEQPPEGLGSIELKEWKKKHSPSQGQPKSMTAEADAILAENEKKGTFMGGLDAYAREAVPTLSAAAAGALAGSVIPGFGTITGAAAGVIAERLTKAGSPFLAELMNSKLGTNQLSSEEKNTQIFDKMGLQYPDTPGERIAGKAGEGTAEGLGVWAGGTALSANTPALMQGNTAQRVGNVLKEAPGIQIAGETFSGAGAQGGMEIAANKNMGQIGTMLMMLGGAAIGDLTGNQLAKLEDQVRRVVQAKGMDLPEAVKDVLQDFKGNGEAYLSDFPAKTRDAQDFQDYRKTVKGGYRDLTFKRRAQRVALSQEIGTRWGVEPDDYYAKDIVDDLMSKRSAELGVLTGNRADVVEKLMKPADDMVIQSPQNAQDLTSFQAVASVSDVPKLTGIPKVPTPKTTALIRETSAKLGALNDTDLDTSIRKLANWEQMLQEKDFAQMIRQKNSISNYYSDPALANVSTDVQKDFNNIRNVLNEELNNYVKNNVSNADYNKYMASNARLSEMMDDFKRTTLKQLLDGGEYNPKTVTSMLRDTDKTNADMLFNALNPIGQARARSALIATATANATRYGKLSPNELSEQLVKEMPQLKAFFAKDDMATLEGQIRFLQHTIGDEGNLTEVPTAMPGEKLPGGKYALARMIFANPLVGITIAGGTSLSSGWLVRFMEKGPQRDMLLKLGTLAPNSEEAGRLIKRLTEMANATASAEDPLINVDAVTGADPGGNL